MKPVRKIPPKCKTCRFFSGKKDDPRLSLDEINFLQGVCRRHAPIPYQGEEDELCSFPLVMDEDWCGDWQGKGGK